jgi:hypothetical protein
MQDMWVLYVNFESSKQRFSVAVPLLRAQPSAGTARKTNLFPLLFTGHYLATAVVQLLNSRCLATGLHATILKNKYPKLNTFDIKHAID